MYKSSLISKGFQLGSNLQKKAVKSLGGCDVT